MRSLLLASVALASLTVPTYALSLQEVYERLGGLDCSGNTCTDSETISTTIENPDIITEVELPDIETVVELPDGTFDTVVVTPSTVSEDPGAETVTVGCLKVTMAGNPIPADRLAFFCTGNNSLSPLRGGGFPKVATVTTVVDGGTETVITDGGTTTVITDGGTSVVESCVTTTYTVSHPGNGGNGHGHGIPQGGWNIDEDSSESDGAC